MNIDEQLRTQLAAAQAAMQKAYDIIKTDYNKDWFLSNSQLRFRATMLNLLNGDGTAALDAVIAEATKELREQIRVTYGDLQHYVTRSDELARKLMVANAATKPLVDALKTASKTLSKIRNAPGNTLNPYDLSREAYETQSLIDSLLK